jgi:hypothetical protein
MAILKSTIINGTLTINGKVFGIEEIDPIFVASAAYGITGTNISDWNDAYGWGDHSTEGYVTSSGVTSVSAGAGMNFTTITETGSVTLGTPSTITASTENSVTTNSHTHTITNYSLSGTSNQIVIAGEGKVLGAATTLSLPQDIHDGATPTFAELILDAGGINQVPESGTDIAGTNLVIASGQGTGTGTVSSIKFQTPTITDAGTTAQSLADRLTINSTGVIISGNLQIDGTTTTINTATMTIDDPILTLGGDTAPVDDDSKDRGVEYRWHNGTDDKLGFFGYDNSSQRFTFIPDATNNSEVFSGDTGVVRFSKLELSGLNGKVGIFETSADSTDKTYTFPNATGTVALTDDIGNGVLTLTTSAGTTNTGVIIETGTGFTANATTNATYNINVGPALTNLASIMTGETTGLLKKTAEDTYTLDTTTYLSSVADAHSGITGADDVNGSGYQYIQDITMDAYGHVTAVGTSTWSHPNTSDQASMTTGGRTYINSITLDDAGHVTALGTNTETVEDTHYTSKNIVGASNGATEDAVAVNGNVWLNHLEDSTVTSAHNIVGSGATTVSSDANGKITIDSVDNNDDTKNTTGSDNTSSKIYLVGALNQTAYSQTYSDNEVYVTDGKLNAKTIETSGALIVGGDLTVSGTTTTINTSTLQVEDINIELGSVSSPNNTTADGGGITLKGEPDKTIIWEDTDDSWHYNQNIVIEETTPSITLSNSTTSGKIQYNSTTESIEFIFE